MHRVGGGVPVGDQQSALPVVFAPVLLIGGVAIHRVEGGRGVGVHIIGMAAKRAAQIQPDQCRGFLTVPGEGQAAERHALLRQCPAQKLGLCGLSGTVGSLKNDQLSHRCPLFRGGHTGEVYHHSTHL